jgi:hypothetical protein
VKLGRKTRHQQAFKKAKQDKLDRKAKLEAGKKRGVERVRQQWQAGSTAAFRADREENPDRDKTKLADRKSFFPGYTEQIDLDHQTLMETKPAGS